MAGVPWTCGAGGSEVNGTPCAQPTPTCSGGSCTCTETTCGSTCTTLNTTSNCSACGDVCTPTNASSASCTGTTCQYACNPGVSSDCNFGTPPDTDGCECATPTCCGTGCETTHSDGVAQNYFDCSPLYVTSPSCTFSYADARGRATAYATAQGFPSRCAQFLPCTTGTVRTDSICYTDSTGMNAVNYCWGYTCGSDAGWVESPTCPTTQAGAWN